MKKIIYIIGMVCLAVSCSSNKQSDNGAELVQYRGTETDDLADQLFDRVEMIPLETADSILLGAFPDLAIDGNSFYLIDRMGSHTIKRFDVAGKYLNTIGRVGRGVGEYISIKDYRITPDSVVIFSMPKVTGNIYDTAGVFVSAFAYDFNAQKVMQDEDDYWLYVGYKNSYGSDKLLKVNKKGDVIGRYLSSKANILQMADDIPMFVEHDNQIYLRETLSDVIYQIDDQGLHEFLRFDFGKYAIPEEYFEKNDPFLAAEFLFSRDFATLRRLLINEDYVVVMADIKKQGKQICSYGIKHIKSGKWQWYDLDQTVDNTNKLFIYTLCAITPDNELLFVVDAPLFLKATEDGKPDWTSFSDKRPNIKDSDNSVILKCKLK